MVFSWFKRRRRRKLLDRPFPAQWLEYLRRHVLYYSYLNDEEQAKLRDDLRCFIAEKHWEGCGGLEMTDEITVTVAAQACLLTLALEDDLYDRLKSILVYPAGYSAPDHTHVGGGVVIEGQSHRLGEAWYRGPVILSWRDVKAGGRHAHDGENLVFHEFAHQLDMRTGTTNGTPPLSSREQVRQWNSVMTEEFDRLCRAAEDSRATLLDHYGATDEAEFFAVSTECFFERPLEMHRRHPELYALLCEYYRQDPAARFDA